MLADVACETPVHFQDKPELRAWLCFGYLGFRALGFRLQNKQGGCHEFKTSVTKIRSLCIRDIEVSGQAPGFGSSI